MISLLALLLVVQQPLPDRTRAADLGSWAICDDGQHADLRPDIPVVVLGGTSRAEGAWVPAYETAFVLYGNGQLIRRTREGLVESRLRPPQIERLARTIDVEALARLDAQYDRTTDRQRDLVRTCFHCQPRETTLAVWVRGCRKTIRISGLSHWTAARMFGAAGLPDPDYPAQEARSILASLPSPLQRALRTMFAHRPDHSRTWCRLKECFRRERSLPYEALWVGDSNSIR